MVITCKIHTAQKKKKKTNTNHVTVFGKISLRQESGSLPDWSLVKYCILFRQKLIVNIHRMAKSLLRHGDGGWVVLKFLLPAAFPLLSCLFFNCDVKKSTIPGVLMCVMVHAIWKTRNKFLHRESPHLPSTICDSFSEESCFILQKISRAMYSSSFPSCLLGP